MGGGHHVSDSGIRFHHEDFFDHGDILPSAVVNIHDWDKEGLNILDLYRKKEVD